jgi:hypothetical protein
MRAMSPDPAFNALPNVTSPIAGGAAASTVNAATAASNPLMRRP